MLHTILVPLDGSALAEAALFEARRVARETKAMLVLMRVTSLAAILPDAHAAPAAEEVGSAEAGAYLQRAARNLASDGFRVRTALYCASPAEGILLAAVEEHADLIVMSTHGRSGLRRVVLGSVAETVVRDAPVPVLLVRAFHRSGIRRERPYRKVLVPLDCTEPAASALRYVARAPFTRGAEVVMLYSQPPASTALAPGLMGYVPGGVFEQVEQEAARGRSEARAYLEAMAQAELRGRHWNAYVSIGDPGEEILHLAGDDGMDLIAMATHGRSGMDRLMHGSVAAHVLHHTDVPVLLLRATAPGAARATAAPDAVQAAVVMGPAPSDMDAVNEDSFAVTAR